jgi:hypothetical protein
MLVQRVCNAPAQARVRLWCYLTSIEGRVRAGSEPVTQTGRLPLPWEEFAPAGLRKPKANRR